MTKKCLYKTAAFIVVIVFLSVFSCSKVKKNDSLQGFFKAVKSKKIASVFSLPRISVKKITAYKAQRDPFHNSSSSSPTKQELKAGKGIKAVEPLKKYPLNVLKLLGTVVENKNSWAIIATPDGMVYRVPSGAAIGSRNGTIESIGHDEIKIIERNFRSGKIFSNTTFLRLRGK